jgi:GDP-6-deoxy-D-talose 4-dehydrogenase
MALKARHVCITGISGFTGRHLARHLLDGGWQVSGIGPEAVPNASAHLDADIGDRKQVAEWLTEVRPTHIVHLAALANVVGEPLPYYRVNVLGTEALIEAAARAVPGLTKLIIASSASVYGNAKSLPISEDAPIRPINHYALSKAASEFVAVKWFQRLPIVITRPFNYTGPGQSEGFVYAKLAAAFRRRESVIRLGNAEVSRDLSDVQFVCEAYARLLKSQLSGECVNICSGRSVSIATAIDVLHELTGHMPILERDNALDRADDIRELRGDPTRLFAAVGDIVAPPIRETFAAMLATG